MPEPETKPGETPIEQATETEAATVQTGDSVTLTKAEYEKMQAALKEANAEAAKRRKEIERIEAERKTAEEAKLSDLEKAQKKLAELEAEIQRRDMETKKRAIAAKVGLPDALALRLVGSTDEELEKDAKTLLETLPKPQAPKTSPVNPGAGGTTGETDDQKRARLSNFM